jgi:DNA ligase (NAD+)
LAKESTNIDSLAQMTVEELIAIDQVGEKVANSVYEFFRDEENIELLNRLKGYGINYREEEKNENSLEVFSGKSFLFTGKLARFGRNEIKDIVESLGGTNLSSVSKKLDYLIVGEDAGSKLSKAQELGTVTILTEEDFFQMINKDKQEEIEQEEPKEEKPKEEEKIIKTEQQSLF